jgi:uncharacterized membrane protein YkvA (DUF1232 family)
MQPAPPDADPQVGRVTWSERVRRLKAEVRALYLAARHPRTPLVAKLVAAFVAGYAFSPLDLIPDVIPVIGYLDDALLLPLGIWLAIRLIPGDVLDECRRQAAEVPMSPRGRIAAGVVVAVWLALAIASALLLRRLIG